MEHLVANMAVCVFRSGGSSPGGCALDVPGDGPALRAFCLPEQNTQPLEEHQTVCQHGRQKCSHQRPDVGAWYTLILTLKLIRKTKCFTVLSLF